ncbi:NAD-dependent epimerase/dehydratase family protein [Embleya sp. NPDC050154]|uniref:NAD-dependent epimerase/dehydratase family protein n=1 Tax=unclassified Embleya TaxID=2699296 RepID=UPI0037A45B39
MSSQPPRVRSGRSGRESTSDGTGTDASETAPEPIPSASDQPSDKSVPRVRPVIAVTGAAAGLGHRVASLLAANDQVKRLIAIDERRGEIPGAQWRIMDVRDPALAGRLEGVDVVVHLALDMSLDSEPRARGARNVRGTQTVLTAAAAARVPRVVLCTSAMVYGALPDNAVPLAEDAPLRATADASLVGDLLEIEELAERTPRAHPHVKVTVVRPATLVGGPEADSVMTRHFEAPRLLVVSGGQPRWQFCHLDDLASALEFAALGRVEGVVTVGSEGWLEQEEIEELSGMRRMELPASLALGTAERLHRLGITPAPAGDLAYTMHGWVVPSERLRAAGWRPVWTNEAAFAVLLEDVDGRHALVARRLGRKDATTLGAAGATVALVGTAAIVRKVRRRRRGF